MPILDIQERFRELGRIRTGILEVPAEGKPRPKKLAKFRLTSKWRHLLDDAAVAFGGNVRAWEHPQEGPQFELLVEAQAIDVVVPPGEILSQWYELWSGGGCQRRCDGVRQVLTDSPCACPDDPNERREAANAGRACKPTTRLSVMIPAVGDLGIWRLESHGYNAAVELGGAASLCELATRRGIMIPATLRLEARSSRKPGEAVKRFAVPALSFRGNLGETLEALGLTSGALPIAPPARMAARPELDAGGTPELPAAPDPIPDAKAEVERASVPTTPVPEPDAFEPPEREPDEREDGAALSWAQMFAMRARDCPPISNEVARHGLMRVLSQGRTGSGKELTAEERTQAMAALVRLARGDATLELEAPNTWVFKTTRQDGSAVELRGIDPDVAQSESPALDDEERARLEALGEEPFETPPATSDPTPSDDVVDVDEAVPVPLDAEAWRAFLGQHRLKIGDAIKAAAQVRPDAKIGELPGNLEELAKDPELCALVAKRLTP